MLLLAVRVFQSVNGGNVRMIQRGKDAGFALESCNTIRIASEGFGENLDGDAAAQFRVRGPIHVAHPARTQMCGDLVMCEFCSDQCFS